MQKLSPEIGHGFRARLLLEIPNEINDLRQLSRIAMHTEQPFDFKFTSREVTVWGALALLKRMLYGMCWHAALQS